MFSIRPLPQAAKFSESSIAQATVDVGQNGTHVSFPNWESAADVEDNSTIIVAVTALGIFASEGIIIVGNDITVGTPCNR